MSNVNSQLHQVVVILDETVLGFTSVRAAVAFIEEAFIEKNANQILEMVTTALSDDPEDNLKIMSIDVYEDMYLDDDSDEYVGTDLDED